MDVVRSEISQASMLGLSPYLLVRIELRCVTWKFLRDNFRMFGEMPPYHLGSVVHITAVPDDGKRSGKIALETAQEIDHVRTTDVLVLGEEPEIQASSLSFGTDCDCADRRDPVMPIPATVDGRLPTRRKGAPDRRREPKPRFIKENEARASTCSVFLCAGILRASSVRSRPRLAPWPCARVSGKSSPNAPSRSCAHARGGTSHRNAA